MASASSLYLCKDARGKKYYSNMPESGRCVSYSTNKLGIISLSGKWPGYSSNSYKNVRYHKQIDYWGKRYNIDPNLIKAIIRAESGFDRYAISKKGAQGLMQLMPDTAREMRVSDPFNPEENIAGGVRYLRKLLKMFNGNLVLSLAAYNAGPGQVKKAGGVPRITETRRYIKRVLSYYDRYAKA
ncbi:MAG: lytic transglycosylase domain-containing protein [Desulfofustis sp.]|nr:lytic transglycosylase domain-containing protein [Desulfofustis sp.]